VKRAPRSTNTYPNTPRVSAAGTAHPASVPGGGRKGRAPASLGTAVTVHPEKTLPIKLVNNSGGRGAFVVHGISV